MTINEEELRKALQYDRDQYEKGYEDGKRDAVVHGRWIKDEIESEKHVEAIYICSSCKNFDAWGEVEKTYFKFCPNCGAKMDGKEE